jgi:hypothetical protein
LKQNYAPLEYFVCSVETVFETMVKAAKSLMQIMSWLDRFAVLTNTYEFPLLTFIYQCCIVIGNESIG